MSLPTHGEVTILSGKGFEEGEGVHANGPIAYPRRVRWDSNKYLIAILHEPARLMYWLTMAAL